MAESIDGWSIFLKLTSLRAEAAVGDNYKSLPASLEDINFSFLERWLDLNFYIGMLFVTVNSSMFSPLP